MNIMRDKTDDSPFPPTQGSGQDGSTEGVPSRKDLEKDITDFLAKKYGGKVRVVSQMVFPKQPHPKMDGSGPGHSDKNETGIKFNMKPEELEAYLDRHVIRQEKAKAVLATKICTHFNRIKYLREKGSEATPLGNIKNNIILIGPTGVGKTFLVKLIASKLGVPFVKGDATKFSETGYVGGDVEDLVRDLVQEADGDIEKARYGIIYIDEIDKIASSQHLHGPDVSRAGVQRALLKPMEETEVDLRVPHDPISQLEAIERFRRSGRREKNTLNTRDILFIVSGAFSGLADIIKKRMCRLGIGFGAEIEVGDEQDWLRHVKPQDLIEYGFESEFVGRLPVITILEELGVHDLYMILKNPNNAVTNTKKQDFRAYGIDLRFEDAALRLLATQAYEEKTGARALVSVMERALLPFEKKLPSTDISYLVVTPEMVRNPEEELEKFLSFYHSPEYRKRYDLLLNEDRQAIVSRLRELDLSHWNEQGIPLTDTKFELAARMVQIHGMEPEVAEEKILALAQRIRAYEKSFLERCDIRITFDEKAVEWLMKEYLDDPAGIYTQCERLCNILEYGLSIVRDRTGRSNFLISEEAAQNPELYINQLIRACYKSSE